SMSRMAHALSRPFPKAAGSGDPSDVPDKEEVDGSSPSRPTIAREERHPRSSAQRPLSRPFTNAEGSGYPSESRDRVRVGGSSHPGSRRGGFPWATTAKERARRRRASSGSSSS